MNIADTIDSDGNSLFHGNACLNTYRTITE